MLTINHFKIGAEFFWVDANGNPLINKPDTIIAVNTQTGIIKGKFIAAVHYKHCRLVHPPTPEKKRHEQGWFEFLSK